MIIALLNQKGGVGKTTLTINLAHAFVLLGRRVLLVDADAQASAADWQAVRGKTDRLPLFSVVSIPRPTLHREVPALAADYNITLIDCPPRDNDIMKSSLATAGLCLIPSQPSAFDMWAVAPVLRAAEEVQLYRPQPLKIVFVVNRKVVNTAIGRDIHASFGQFHHPVLDCAVSQRVAFAEAAGAGSTVFELDPAGAAAGEIMAVASAIIDIIGAPSSSAK